MVQRSGAAQCNVGNVSQGKNLFIFFRESLVWGLIRKLFAYPGGAARSYYKDKQ